MHFDGLLTALESHLRENRRKGRVEVDREELARRLDVCRACPIGYFTPAGCVRFGSPCKRFDAWVYKLGRRAGCDQWERDQGQGTRG